MVAKRRQRSWRDRGTVDGRSWQVRQATDNLVNAMKSEPVHLQDVDADFANAFKGHRTTHTRDALNAQDVMFMPSLKLDTTQIDDRRGDKWKPRQTPPLAKQIPRRRKWPQPPEKPKRPVNQGRHDAELPRLDHSAFAGDGRVERPAPAPPREGPRQRGRAGTAPTQPVRPKPKVKPRFNQGRHDA